MKFLLTQRSYVYLNRSFKIKVGNLNTSNHDHFIRKLHMTKTDLQKKKITQSASTENKEFHNKTVDNSFKIEHKSNWELPNPSVKHKNEHVEHIKNQNNFSEKLLIGHQQVDNTRNGGVLQENFKLNKFQIVGFLSPSRKHNSLKELFRDPNVPEWKKQKEALKRKFNGEGWNPTKKLSREEMKSVKFLRAENPTLNNAQLAEYFKVSPEAIRRILKSKWEPKTLEEEEKLQERWVKRGEKIKSMVKNNVMTPSPTTNKPHIKSHDDTDLLFISEEQKRIKLHETNKPLSIKKKKQQRRGKNNNQNSINPGDFEI